jgi:hypothetical protein
LSYTPCWGRIAVNACYSEQILIFRSWSIVGSSGGQTQQQARKGTHRVVVEGKGVFWPLGTCPGEQSGGKRWVLVMAQVQRASKHTGTAMWLSCWAPLDRHRTTQGAWWLWCAGARERAGLAERIAWAVAGAGARERETRGRTTVGRSM